MRIRSLRTRWTIALVAVCVLEALLVAVAVRVTTARAFERFVVEEAFEVFVERVESEARTQGTLTGDVPRSEPSRPQPPPRRQPPRLDDTQITPPGRREQPRPRRESSLPSPVSLGDGIAFGLADAQGYVLRPFDRHAVGDSLSPSEQAAGRAILVDGSRLGTAFVPRNAANMLADFPGDSPEARFIASSTTALAAALAGALVLALGFGAWLAGRTTQPLGTLTNAVRAVTAGDLHQSVAVTTSDEVGALADAFNTMSTRLANATALRQRMTADVSHDLRTPVTAVLGTLELIETGVLAPTPERIRAARVEAQRLARLIENFHTLALADAGELPIHPARVDAADALLHTATLFEAQAKSAGVDLAVEVDDVHPVQADVDRLAQILANLVSNALRHTPTGGRVTLGAHVTGGNVAVTVADTGSGIPPDVLPHVFERSVRADASRSGGGAGLGLSIVRSLAQAMNGSVGAESVPGEGTTVTVRLPMWSHQVA